MSNMLIGNKEFETGKRPYIMGILNVTPDSFSDGGNYDETEMALAHAKKMIEDGADIIDVGGESTRPGFTQITAAEEIERVLKIIERLNEEFDVPISLDTYKSEVAAAGIKAGATMINDIWGLKWDGSMARVIAENGVSCCIMHNRKESIYGNFLTDVANDLKESVDMAMTAGIAKDKIMLDPGIGFAKSTEQNLLVMNNLQTFAGLGFPVLLGASRKSVIGNTLNLPVDEREEGTIATSVLGLMKGASFFRVHDVKANKRALMMADAILKTQTNVQNV